MVCTS